MDQIKKLLASLSVRQRVTVALFAVLTAASIFAFSRWWQERDFKPLYSGLNAEDAAAVVQKLREEATTYRLSENGTVVLAPSAKVAELRLKLAAAGVPKSGRIGFELFDRTNFGATEFAEQVNYRRALEGELERSVMALTEIEQARVHVTFPKDSIFLESRQPGKASVLVRIRSGARLEAGSVQAITHLVASAVDGLAPEAISVLDMNGRLLSRARSAQSEGVQNSGAQLEHRQQIERDLVAKINSTLEPLLGAERFKANVSVECDFSSGEHSEETFDPSRSVMVSSQKTEDVSGTSTAAGVPGTASNLPRPTSRPGAGGLGTTRRSESVSYQSSRTVRHLRLPQGTLKKMSMSVLVDHDLRWDGSGTKAKRVLDPPSPEKIKVIRDLVAAATGFSAERGDQLIVESLPFDSTLHSDPPLAPPPASSSPKVPGLVLPAWLENRLPMVAIVSGGAILLVLIGLVLLFRRARRRAHGVSVRESLPHPGAALPGLPAPNGSQVQGQMEARLTERAQLQQRAEADAMDALSLPPPTTKKAEVLRKHLTESTKKDPAAAAQILRTWLYDMER
jgi:flagellar M-ring protein FliF